jgi:peptidoglycan/LPS O-acetylase OafA/YrhL
MQNTNRVMEIDFLRFWAALMVVFYHYLWRSSEGGYTQASLSHHHASIAKYCYLGVDLFFLISGFVIFMTALKQSWKDFLISRVVRLYPAYLICCTITFLITTIVGNPKLISTPLDYLVNLTMLNIPFGVRSVDGVYWSLFVEIRFYFLAFLAVSTHAIKYPSRILFVWLSFVILLKFYRIPFCDFFLVSEQAPYFIAGGAFYLTYKEGYSAPRLILILISYVISLLNSTANRDGGLMIGLIITSFYLGFFLIAFKRAPRLGSPLWPFLGALTYPLYLLHQYNGYIFIDAHEGIANGYVTVICVIFVMLFISFLVNRYVEIRYSKKLKAYLKSLFVERKPQEVRGGRKNECAATAVVEILPPQARNR